MPNAPDSSLSDSLAKKSLCVFFCAPLVNPLNGKTVGPDRDRVKALGRIVKWSEKSADVWIDEEYLPVQSGDVIADLHTWDEKYSRGAGELARSEWWTAIETASPSSDIPTRKETTLIERGFNVTVSSTRGADHLDGIDPSRPHRQLPAQVALPSPPVNPKAPPVIPQPLPVIAPMPAVQPQPSPPRESPTTIVRRFMTAHCEKSGHGDIRAYINELSDPIDYYDRGMLRRAEIMSNALRGQTEYSSMTQNLKSIHITPLSPTNLEAHCVIEYVNVKNGVETRATSGTSFEVELAADGPKIVKIRAEKIK